MKEGRKFVYINNVKWAGGKKGILSAEQRPSVEVATPAEFRGHEGVWTPEDFLTAAVNSCIMTTFCILLTGKVWSFSHILLRQKA